MAKSKDKKSKTAKPAEADFEPVATGDVANAEPASGPLAAPDEADALPKGFSLDAPELLKSVDAAAMRSGGYPYDKKMKREEFDEQLHALQVELNKLQTHNLATGSRILCLFEGRDGAGKGSCISAFAEHLNPRNTRVVALTKPTETERGQLYFQRYLVHLPTAGETVLFDRSWYNRGGVERVMGFCTEDQLAKFLREAPDLEGLLVRDGIKLFKFYLGIGREMQLKRFYERRHDPLKQWKLSSVDMAALTKYSSYSRAQTDIFRFTHTPTAPWVVVRANDQRRARLEAIRHVLLAIDYAGRDLAAIGQPDARIIGSTPELMHVD